MFKRFLNRCLRRVYESELVTFTRSLLWVSDLKTESFEKKNECKYLNIFCFCYLFYYFIYLIFLLYFYFLYLFYFLPILFWEYFFLSFFFFLFKSPPIDVLRIPHSSPKKSLKNKNIFDIFFSYKCFACCCVDNVCFVFWVV